MKRQNDINIIKHSLLQSVIDLQEKKEPAIVPDTVIEHAINTYRIERPRAEVMAGFMRLWQDEFIEIQEERLLKGRYFVTGLSTEGLEMLLHRTFIKAYEKEQRNRWNETGQIISPYISIAALIITAVLFIVDKCSEPSTYEVTIDKKTYTIKEK